MNLVSAALIAWGGMVEVMPTGRCGIGWAGLLCGTKTFHVVGRHSNKVFLVLQKKSGLTPHTWGERGGTTKVELSWVQSLVKTTVLSYT